MALVTQQRLEFEQSVDGMFLGAIEARKDPELMRLLRAEGLDLEGKLQPAYPAEKFYRWLHIAARHRYPTLSANEGLKRLGTLAVERGLSATMMGRAVLVMMKTLGVRRSLMRIAFSFKSGNNYIAPEAIQLSPTRIEIRFNTVMNTPGYFEGVLEAGTKMLGGKDVKVKRTDPGIGETAVFQIDWTE